MVENSVATHADPGSLVDRRPPLGTVLLDPVRRVVTHRGTPLPISARLYDTLNYLAEHSGRVVTKDELLDAVWPNKVVEESNVSQAIFALRKALATSGATEAIIATAPGQGYRFTGQAQWIGAEPPPPAVEGSPPSAQANVTTALRSRKWVAPMAVVTAAVGAIVGGLIWHSRPAGAAHNRIVLADFANPAHDAIFDHTLDNVVRADLSQSPWFDVVRPKEVQATLGLMERPQDTLLTSDLAQEVCSRTNSQAVLGGEIDEVGSQYIVTVDAGDCSGQHALGSAKAQVSRREDVVPALDKLIAQLRGSLGEPMASVNQFDVPLVPAQTGSLEALKAYSEGIWLNNHGQEAAAVAPIERSVVIDPQFGAAWFSLAGIYNNLEQHSRADVAVVRAYALRDQFNERQRINLEVYYAKIHTGDYAAQLRALQRGTAIYPTEWTYWVNLANAQSTLGNYESAAQAAIQAVSLKAPSELAYLALVNANLGRGDLQAAHAASALALQRGFAGASIHAALMAMAVIENDQPGYQKQLAWAATQPEDTTFLTVEANLDYRAGQIAKGDKVFQRIAYLSGAGDANDPNLGVRARLLHAIGYEVRAKSLLTQARSLDDDQDVILAQAQFGDAAWAERQLQRQAAQNPDMTLIDVDFAPRVRALLALRSHQPQAASSALAPALPYAARSFEVPFIQGQAFLAAGDASRAADAFTTILAHPGRDPESPLFSLAGLWLARSLVSAHRLPAAKIAYRQFLAEWHAADADIPLLKQARAEYAALPDM